MQEVLVPDFDAVWPTLRNFAKELVECVHNPATGKVAGVEVAELEHEQARRSAEVFARLNERSSEQFGIQEVFVGLALRGRRVGFLFGNFLIVSHP